MIGVVKILDDQTALNEFTIIPILDSLRKPNGKKPKNVKFDSGKKLKTFADVVSEKWGTLGIEGSPNPKLLELMIIEAVDGKYGKWKDNKELKIRKQMAKNFDATLLSFGLLKGYPHTKGNANTWLEDRYRKYLMKSIYIEIFYPDDGTYEEIEKKAKTKKPVKQPRQLNTFGKIADKGKESIALDLFEMIKNKTYKEYFGENGDVIAYEIPEPCFTLENSPILTEQESEPAQASSEEGDSGKTGRNGMIKDGDMEGEGFAPLNPELPKPDSLQPELKPEANGLTQDLPEENTDDGNQGTSEEDKDSNNTVEKDKIENEDGEDGETVSPQPEPPKPKKDIRDILLIVAISTFGVAVVLSIIILGTCVLYSINNAEEKNSSTAEAIEDARNQKAQEITILNKENLSSLDLGEKAYIAVETDPRELNPHELWYISSNPSVVAVKDDHDGQIKAAEQLVDGVENRSDITVKDPDSGAQDSITIFVDDQDSRASEGKGGNNSSDDGEAQ